MQIQKIQSNQTMFGTKIRVSPELIRDLHCEGRAALRRDFEVLKNNGKNDTMFLSYHPDEHSMRHCIQADVIEIKSAKSQKIGTAQTNMFQENSYNIFNVVDLYKKARENMYNNQIRIKDWQQYL